MDLDFMVKIRIEEILARITRPGKDELIKFLVNSDFYTAPASTRFHGSYAGGLANHSLEVYNLLWLKAEQFNFNVSEDTLAICGLLHDVCKINLYVMGKKNVKENGKWSEKDVWEHRDSFPMGHGEKSVYIINKFFDLSDEEALAIRWHMGFSEPRELWSSLSDAFNKSPLVTALFTSDMEASHILENMPT